MTTTKYLHVINHALPERTGLCDAILHEVLTALDGLVRDGTPHAIDLRGLPLTEVDREELDRRLGRGEVLVHHTLQAVSGAAAEQARLAAIASQPGEYLVVVDGSVPAKDGGVYSTIAGMTNLQMLEETVQDAFAVIAVGSCAAFGGLPHAFPNPTGAVPISELVTDKPLINVSGCPPIPVVITGVLSHLLAFGQLPELDALRRPKAFFGESIHDRCYRRGFYEQGKFARSFDDEGARLGHCLYHVGCKGPVTYNACATLKWNRGASFPIQSGHGCFSCSEPDFWDQEGGLYAPLSAGRWPGGASVGAAVGVGAALGAGAAALSRARKAAATRALQPPPTAPQPEPGDPAP